MRESPLHKFEETLFSVRQSRRRVYSISALAASALMVLGTSWAFLAKVPLYIVGEAVITASQGQQEIMVQVSGEMTELGVDFGKPIKKGQLIVAIDDREAKKAYQEALDHRESLLRRLERTKEWKQTLETNLRQLSSANRYGMKEVRALAAEKRILARRAKEKVARLKDLPRTAEASTYEREEAGTSALTAELIANAWTARLRDRSAALQSEQALEQQIFAQDEEIERLERELGTQEVTLEVAKKRLKQHRVTSPVDGELIGRTNSLPGNQVREGDLIATIVPYSDDLITTELSAHESGKVRVGQPAWFELSSYPAARYGRISATVKHVIRSSHKTTTLVVLSFDDRDSVRSPIATGERGQVYIEVESTRPISTLLETL